MSGDSQHNDSEPQQLRARIAELERELRKAEQENESLRESDAYWRSLVQWAPVYLSIVDHEGRLLFLNRTGGGYRPDEILGMSVVESCDPEHREMIQEKLARVLAHGTTENYEACDAQQRRWYSTTAGPLYRNREIVAVVQCSEDITDKQEIRRRLSESEMRWRTLLENAPDIIVLFDAQGRISFINRTTDAYLKAELVGERGLDFLTPKDQVPLQRAIADVFATGEARDVEFTESRGGRVYLARIALLGSSENGQMAIAICRDMTADRQRQQELLDSEARLRLAVQQIPIVLWTTDGELRFTSSMGAGLGLLGLEPGANIGLSMYEYFQTDDPEFPAIAAHQAALEGRSVEYTQSWREHVFQANVEPLRDAEGKIVGVVGVALDVTARHVTEQQLRQTSSDLEARVRERTVELDALNRQLLVDLEHRRVAERELRESEERFRVIAESLPIAVVIIRRLDRRAMYANEQACDLFDTSLEVLNRGDLNLPCGDEAVNRQCLAALDDGKSIHDFETRVQRADGSSIWISLSVAAIQYQGEDAILCGMLNTTRRKEAEEELLKERRLLTRLLDLHERDRQLIAYEIHDGFVQDVTAAVMFLESAEVALGETTSQAAVHVQHSIGLLRESLGEARRMINGLRPPVLEEAGVVAAVEELIAKIQQQYQLEVELQAALQAPRMAPALEMAVYRIVQEALTNVHRHSQSPRALVSIEERNDRLHLRVRDWGIGFDPQRTPKKRYGLTGMQERAKLLGGQTTIDSKPGSGTEIRVDLPLVAVNFCDAAERLPLTAESPLD